MKILASLVASVILFHGVCLGRCIGERSRVTPHAAVPPCHHQNPTPDGSDSPQPFNTCAEGPALEAKITPFLKCAPDVAVLPAVAPSLAHIADEAWPEARRLELPQISAPALRPDVLRI